MAHQHRGRDRKKKTLTFSNRKTSGHVSHPAPSLSSSSVRHWSLLILGQRCPVHAADCCQRRPGGCTDGSYFCWLSHYVVACRGLFPSSWPLAIPLSVRTIGVTESGVWQQRIRVRRIGAGGEGALKTSICARWESTGKLTFTSGWCSLSTSCWSYVRCF